MLIGVNYTKINGMSKNGVKACVKEVEDRNVARSCCFCGTNQDVIAHWFSLGERVFNMPVCRHCLKHNRKYIEKIFQEYVASTQNINHKN